MRFASILIDSVTTVLEDYRWSFSYWHVFVMRKGSLHLLLPNMLSNSSPYMPKGRPSCICPIFSYDGLLWVLKRSGCVFVLFSFNYQLETAHSHLRGRLQLRNYPNQICLWPCVGNCLYYKLIQECSPQCKWDYP